MLGSFKWAITQVLKLMVRADLYKDKNLRVSRGKNRSSKKKNLNRLVFKLLLFTETGTMGSFPLHIYCSQDIWGKENPELRT